MFAVVVVASGDMSNVEASDSVFVMSVVASGVVSLGIMVAGISVSEESVASTMKPTCTML